MAVSLKLFNQSQNFGPWRQPESEVDNNAAAIVFSNISVDTTTQRRIQKTLQCGSRTVLPASKPFSPSLDSTPFSSSRMISSSIAPVNTSTALSTSYSSRTLTRLGPAHLIPQECFAFHASKQSPAPVEPAPKRRRLSHDVDEPNTATQGCKKRRLRRDLITSRLSQPFSLPASHILNREAAAGDKGFMKLAAAVAARKLTVVGTHASSGHHPVPAEMMRRAAMLNRFRLRIHDEARGRGDRCVADVAASAALLMSGSGLHGVGFVVNARMPAGVNMASTTDQNRDQYQGLAGPTAAPVRHTTTPILKASLPATITRHSHPLSRAAILRCPPSPGLKPLRASRSQINRTMDKDELDDKLLSFPIKDDDMVDMDDVYADFSVIFGDGGESTANEDEDLCQLSFEGEGEQIEDCMDDLDGIPLCARRSQHIL